MTSRSMTNIVHATSMSKYNGVFRTKAEVNVAMGDGLYRCIELPIPRLSGPHLTIDFGYIFNTMNLLKYYISYQLLLPWFCLPSSTTIGSKQGLEGFFYQ